MRSTGINQAARLIASVIVLTSCHLSASSQAMIPPEVHQQRPPAAPPNTERSEPAKPAHEVPAACLSLSSARIRSGNTAVLELSLNALPEAAPAALQWSFQVPSEGISSVTVEDGPALAYVGKTAICAETESVYRCLIVGSNLNEISNGVLARVVTTITPDTRNATVRISNPLATSAVGYWIPVDSENGTISVTRGFAQRQDTASVPPAKRACSPILPEKEDK